MSKLIILRRLKNCVGQINSTNEQIIIYLIKAYKTTAIKKSSFEIFTGMKNIFNAFQKDFDSGKNRDSNYVYGPANPRTIFIGFKMNIL